MLFQKQNGVEAVIPYLKFDSPDPKEKSNVLLAALECVWEAVVGRRTNEEIFLENQGMFIILEVLEKTSEADIKRHLLGTMLDLLENPKARSHVLEWRSAFDDLKGIGNLLVSLWNVEEKSLGGES